MKKISLIKRKKYVICSKKDLILMKMIKMPLKLYNKVRYHCHYTGKYRRAAHSICNVRHK